MNSVLQSLSPAAPPSKRRVPPFWLATFGWVVGCVAVLTVAAAGVPMAAWSPGADAASVSHLAAATAPVAAAVTPRLSTRCQTCGVVQIVRKLQAVGVSPAAYELTVRLRDGTTRISSHSGPAGWRVGDSIMLIGGPTRAAPV